MRIQTVRRLTPLAVSAVGILLVTSLPPASVSAGAGVPRCLGLAASIVGTAGSDELVGTKRRDVVVARGGDDTVRTGGGEDLVCAGGGFDAVFLGSGRDRAVGGRGDDLLDGQRGRDGLRGERGIDFLVGGGAVDVLRAGPGSSFLVEGLLGGPGDDLMVGGPGHDSAHFFDSPRGVQVDLARGRADGHGRDRLAGVEGVSGSDHDDVLVGDQLGNGLFGQGGADLIRGGDSGTVAAGTADVISGDLGADLLRGGGGEDLVTFGRIPVGVVVDFGAGTARGQGRDRLRGVEGVSGSVEADTLLGSRRPDLLAGSLGDDKIDGRAGRDTTVYRDVRGPVEVALDPMLLPDGTSPTGYSRGPAAGADSLVRVEDVWGTRDGDRLYGDSDDNRLLGFEGDDTLVGFGGTDVLDGGAGTDDCDDAADQQVDCEGPAAGGPPSAAATGSARPPWLTWLSTRHVPPALPRPRR